MGVNVSLSKMWLLNVSLNGQPGVIDRYNYEIVLHHDDVL